MWIENENYGGTESDKIAAHIVQYTRGRVLDLGAGTKKAWPHFVNVDSCKMFNGQHVAGVDIILDCKKLSLFANESWDSVYSSNLLEHFERKEVPDVLKEWARVIRPNGYLVLYLPSANFYPKVGSQGANDDHKWDIYPNDIEKILRDCTKCGWTQLEKEERSQNNEYSLFLVFKKRNDGKFVEEIWNRNPNGLKRALVIRYGAIGDQIQTSSVLPKLKEDGYHVTYNTSPPADVVLRNDPNIDSFLIQDKDQVPNQELGPYWAQLEERYDLVINYCESIEGGLLQMPGRLQHRYPEKGRRKLYGKVNYVERMHDIAGVSFSPNPRFYPTEKEIKDAQKERMSINAPVIVWCLTGTSNHKTYPFVDTVLKWIIENTPAHVYLYGDKGVSKILQDAIVQCLQGSGVDIKRIHCICGEWDIRKSITFAKFADICIGPETGIMNAVAMEEVDKIIYLSHSSHENLTRDWVNTQVLAPSHSDCPCYPCHILHYNWDFCHKVEKTAAALCASSIKPETIFQNIMEVLSKKIAAMKE